MSIVKQGLDNPFPNMKLEKYSFLFATVVILLGLSCCKENANIGLEKIDLSQGLSNTKEILLSEIAKDIQYIPLETSNSCLLGRIQKINITESLIYASDGDQLLIFDLNGKFIRRVARKGRGPGEYVEVWDFDISFKERKIFIYDISQKKIIRYNLDGGFESEFHIDFFPSRIALLNNKTIVAAWPFPKFFWNNNSRFISFSLTGVPQESYPAEAGELAIKDEEVFKSAVISSSFFNSCNDTLTYWEQGLNKIFHISTRGEVVTRYNIVTGSNDKNNLNILKYIGTDDYIFFPNCLYRGDIKRIVFNKKTKEVFSLINDHKDPRVRLKAGFTNNIDQGYPFMPDGVTREGKVFLHFNSHDLKLLYESGVIKLNKPINQNQMVNHIDINYLFKNIKDNDNPIVMLVNLK